MQGSGSIADVTTPMNRASLSAFRLRVGEVFLLAAVVTGVIRDRGVAVAVGDDTAAVAPQDDRDATLDEAEEGSLSLPADRGLERELDRARRLAERADWSSAAVALDGLLDAGADAFAGGAGGGASRRSIRTEASSMIDGLPAPGRDAYQMLFRTRAERALAAAVEAGDAEAIVAVARRWFATPAGRHAALIAAFLAIESGDRLSAAGWLGRLGSAADVAAFEPAVSAMRRLVESSPGDAPAATPAGERVRLGGREVRLGDVSAAAPDQGEWRQAGGGASRNTLSSASRPLLAPRYRVPLARHAEESRLLERRRRAAAADEGPMMPAAGVVVVRGVIVTPTPLGILGVDFESGRRLWLQSARPGRATAVDNELQASLARVFDDATSGGLSSDGASVFAVERRGESPGVRGRLFLGPGGIRGEPSTDGTTLTAYDVAARGAVRWRLPKDEPGEPATAPWHLGAPLAVGNDLFVLVEQDGRVRVDVLDAARGEVKWSQPLADVTGDDGDAGPAVVTRRRSGLTPAAAAGVLVCPLGGGAVVALDLATRDLLWAHRYRTIGIDGEAADAGGLFRGRSAAAEARALVSLRGRGPYPVIAGDVVLLAAYDGDGVICVGLRDGAARWRVPMQGRVHVAGVAGDRVIVVSAGGVECLALDTGRRLWQRPHPPGVATSGRGILTAKSILVPTDTPAVVEIALADGGRIGEWATRGGTVPGNLVACRGEVVSRGIDSVDVFHQAERLESRVETARVANPTDPSATYWRGQLDLDRGRVADGLGLLREAAVSSPTVAATRDLVEALVFGLRRDFAAAAAPWRQWQAAGVAAATRPDVVRVVVDGFLRAGEPALAWSACRELPMDTVDVGPVDLLADPSDAALEVRPDRWLDGRLSEIVARGSVELRGQVAGELRERLDAIVRNEPPRRRAELLWGLAAWLGDHPVAAAARGEVANLLGAADGTWATAGTWRLRRSLLEAGRRGDEPVDHWPFGEVVVRRQRGAADAATPGSQIVSIPVCGVVDPAVPGMGIAYDVQERHLLVSDAYGRRLVEPLPIEAGGADGVGMPWIGQSFPIEPSIVGRLLVVRTRSGISAFDLLGKADEPRLVWRYVSRLQEPLAVGMQAIGGRVARNAAIPLGRRITEPDEAARAGIQGPPAGVGGVSYAGPGGIVMLDPVTGDVAWERAGLPAITEWVGDGEALCGCTADGTGCPVLSARDGRLLHRIDLPNRRQRMTAFGRRVVAIVPLDDHALAHRVRIDVIDTLDRSVRTIGEFAGESRAVAVEGRRLAVCEPDGRLTLVDGPSGAVVWQVRLPGLPSPPDAFHVLGWQDRYLVYAAAANLDDPSAGDEELISPLQSVLAASESTPPLPGAVWAVARDDGRMLWPVPATVRGVGLHLAQPSGLPLLLFARQTRTENGHRLVLLGLDKRTGHAVLDERRLNVNVHMFVGCEVEGDPDAATISIRGAHGTTRPVTLEYTGRSIAPRPPHQADAPPAGPAAGLDGLRQTGGGGR
jgi:outer membrane protein assembly factor BamB